MAKQDDYMKTALRLPRDLHAKIQEAADVAERSMNAEIVARLQSSFESSGELPVVVRSQVHDAAERLGISPQEALVRLVLAGARPGAPMVLCVKADAGMTFEQYRAIFEAAKEFTPPDTHVFLE